MPFKLNDAQVRVRALIKDPTAKMILFPGGTGGGKTMGVLDCLIERALAAPGSKHVCFRSTLQDAKVKLFDHTFRKLLELKFPVSDGSSTWEYLREKGAIGLEPPSFRLENDSVIQFAGLDEGDMERSLGPDYTSIFIDEVSEIHKYGTIETLLTRLRQKVPTLKGPDLKLKFIMSCNPPSERHWTFVAFKLGINPATGVPHSRPEQWRWDKIDAKDNVENLADGYLESLNDLDHIAYQRFVVGDWYKDVENPLFHSADIAAARLPVILPEQAKHLYIIIAVDPAVSNTVRSDETGIMVIGRDDDGHAYVLEDLSGKYQPVEWAQEVLAARKRWGARWIVAEKNQGGNLVERNISAEDEFAPVKLIHARDGKDVRAEPTSVAYKSHRVHHCGRFDKLESQLLDMEVTFDRRKRGSPDRVDALVHGLNFLILGPIERPRTMARQPLPGFWRTR